MVKVVLTKANPKLNRRSNLKTNDLKSMIIREYLISKDQPATFKMSNNASDVQNVHSFPFNLFLGS